MTFFLSGRMTRSCSRDTKVSFSTNDTERGLLSSTVCYYPRYIKFKFDAKTLEIKNIRVLNVYDVCYFNCTTL